MILAILIIAIIIICVALWGKLSITMTDAGLTVPDSWLSAVASTSEHAAAPLVQPPVTASSWSVLGDERGFRATRELSTAIYVDGVRYYPPSLTVSCFEGNLYAWMDTGVQAVIEQDPSGASSLVQVNGAPAQAWLAGEGKVLIAPDAKDLLGTLAKSPEAQFSMKFEGDEAQTLVLKTEGAQRLQHWASACARN